MTLIRRHLASPAMIVACVSLVVAPSLAAEYGVEILGPPGIPA